MRTEPWPEPEKHQQGRQRNDGDHRGARHSEAHRDRRQGENARGERSRLSERVRDPEYDLNSQENAAGHNPRRPTVDDLVVLGGTVAQRDSQRGVCASDPAIVHRKNVLDRRAASPGEAPSHLYGKGRRHESREQATESSARGLNHRPDRGDSAEDSEHEGA